MYLLMSSNVCSQLKAYRVFTGSNILDNVAGIKIEELNFLAVILSVMRCFYHEIRYYSKKVNDSFSLTSERKFGKTKMFFQTK